MGVARYKVVLVDSKNKKEQSREWSAVDLVRSVAWLKRMNARGHDVSIAPAGGHGLVLLAGLREDMLAAMSDKGFEPAATIQTGPGQYQAWVKLSDRPLSDDVRQHAVNGLRRALGSQPASSERGEYGSLAGLTCAGMDKDQERGRRFVLVHHASGAVAKEASALLNVIRKALEMKINQRKKILKDNSKLTHKQRGPSR